MQILLLLLYCLEDFEGTDTSAAQNGVVVKTMATWIVTREEISCSEIADEPSLKLTKWLGENLNTFHGAIPRAPVMNIS